MLRALDLYCGAGGATRGLQRAGFHVTGVDINPQPRYCGDVFHQADVLDLVIQRGAFDFIWASPTCQAHTSMKTMPDAKKHADLIPQTRAKLKASCTPYVIENVVGAPLNNPILLCGTMFGLGVDDGELRRHRQFEASFPMLQPACNHVAPRTMGIYGEGVRDAVRKYDKTRREWSVVDGRAAMGIDWMSLAELCQAIPPAYSEFIARAFLAQRQAAAA